MVKVRNLFFFVLFFLIMIGCATRVPHDPRIKLTGYETTSVITVAELATRVNSSGFMEVQVTGVNNIAGYKRFEYKIDWLDKDGFAIKTIMSMWTEFPAYAETGFSFAAVAPDTHATDFRITIRKKGR